MASGRSGHLDTGFFSGRGIWLSPPERLTAPSLMVRFLDTRSAVLQLGVGSRSYDTRRNRFGLLALSDLPLDNSWVAERMYQQGLSPRLNAPVLTVGGSGDLDASLTITEAAVVSQG